MPRSSAPQESSVDHRACRGGLEPLSQAELDEARASLPDWGLEDGALVRTFRFESFAHALEFIDRVGVEAECRNHHPEFALTDKRAVRVTVWTHKTSSLTRLDVDLASAVDAIAAGGMGRTHGLSHIDDAGAARMVDVSAKDVTVREATASARVAMAPTTLSLITTGLGPKGDVISTARLAGVMAAKRTADLVPMCHQLPLDHVSVDVEPEGRQLLVITARVRVVARTGVEMEALTAVSVAALTVYDMCKAVDRDMAITDVRLDHKSGGRSGEFRRMPRATLEAS